MICDRPDDVGDDWVPATRDVRVEAAPMIFPVNDPLAAAISKAVTYEPITAGRVMAQVGDQLFHLRTFTERLDTPPEASWTLAPDFSKHLPATPERN